MRFIKRVLLILILLNPLIPSQERPASFNTPDKIIGFADFLFCSGDYFRASLEYDRYLEAVPNDTIYFKAALGYSNTGHYSEARDLYKYIPQKSFYYSSAQLEYYKTFILQRNTIEMLNETSALEELQKVNPAVMKLYYSGMLMEDKLPPRDNYFLIFQSDKKLLEMYNRKADPERRSPLLAGILSAVVPGSGKFYTGRYIDGIFSFISTGVLAFLAYDNFDAGHEFRGWLFTGLGSLFYAGNIYGAAASANEFNINIRAAFDKDLILSLDQQNYFIPFYDFCD